jgi:hypothetical protein
MKAMTEYCNIVKQGRADAEDFDSFLHHVSGCQDCIRRIQSQIIINFKQRTKEK